MTQLDTLDKIHPDLISSFLTTGKCDGIPADVQLFLKQLQWAAEIYEYERNITRAAKQLRQRINAQLAALGCSLILTLFGLEFKAACGVKDGAAGRDDVRNAAQVHFKAFAVQQAVIAALNADHSETLVQAGAYHSAHSSVHAGSITTACQHANRLDLLFHTRDSLQFTVQFFIYPFACILFFQKQASCFATALIRL